MQHGEAVHRGPLHPMSKCASIVHRQPVSNGSTTSSRLADGLQNRWQRPCAGQASQSISAFNSTSGVSSGGEQMQCASREGSRAFSWPRLALAIRRLLSLKRHGCHLGLIQNVCLKNE
jgi:hypothetical protein